MADSTLALDVVKADGKKAGSIELPAALFDLKTNIPLIHQVVVAQLAAARQGTHSTKRRGEVSGAGRKPFKQKGTGNARQRTPKKMIAAALLGALSDRARGERLHVVESFGIEGAPSTKAAAAVLSGLGAVKNVLVVVDRSDDINVLSVRNLPFAHVLPFDQLNAYDVLVSDDIVFTKAAFDAFVASKSAATEEVSA